MKKTIKRYLSAWFTVFMVLSLVPSADIFADQETTEYALNFDELTELPPGVSGSGGTDILSLDSTSFADDAFYKEFLRLNGTNSGYAQLTAAFDEIKPEGANRYAEISFDLYTSGLRRVGSSITIRINSKIKTLFLSGGGNMYIGENTNGTKIASTAKLDSGNWVNYKFVFQLTDAMGNKDGRIIGVYENGAKVMEDVDCPFNTSDTSLRSISLQLSKKNGEYWLGLDNFLVTSYASADGTSPFPDKTELKQAIQKAITTLADKRNLLEESDIVGFESKINDLMTVYHSTMVSENEIRSAIDDAGILKEDIEDAAETVPAPDDSGFRIVYAKNFNNTAGIPPGITNVGDTLAIDNTEFADNLYQGGYLKLSGSADAYAAFTATFDTILPEGANKYAEIGFDLLTAGQKTVGSSITMRLSSKIKSLYMAGAGGLYIGENTAGAKLASTGALDNENWVNYRLVLQLTDAAGNKVNKIVGVYENGADITQDVDCPFDESYAALSQITMQLSKKQGVYYLGLDNLCVAAYTAADGTSPMADRAFIKTEGEAILKTLDSKLSEYALYDTMKQMVLDTADVYCSETATAEEIAEAKKELESVSSRIDAILSLKESGGSVYAAEPKLSANDLRGLQEVTAEMQLVTYDKAYSGNVVAVLMGAADMLCCGKILDIVSKPVSLSDNEAETVKIHLDLSSYTNLEKQNMRIAAFVLTDLQELSFADENNFWLYGGNAPCDTGEYTFGTEVQAYLKILDSSNQKMVITVNGGKNAAGKVISAAVLKKDASFEDIVGTVEENTEFIYRTTADENGYAVFELSPKGGFGSYSYKVTSSALGNSYSGNLVYSSADIINNALEAIYHNADLQTIEEYAEILTIDTALLKQAKASGVDATEVIKQVFEKKTYDAFSLDEFSREINGALTLLCGIRNAKSVDIIQNLLEIYRDLLKNGVVLSTLKPGVIYTNAMKYIYNHRDGVADINSLDTLILAAMKAANTSEISSGSGGGGRGGDFGGSGSAAAVGYPKVGEAVENIGQTQTPVEKASGMFTDLEEVTWAVPAISMLTTVGCINGKSEGIFAPHDDVTREEFVKMAVSAFGFSNSAATVCFADVEPGSWYAPYVAAAAKAGIVTGESETHFGVGKSITRQEMAAILYRILRMKNQGITEDGVYIEFNDEFKFADYARDAIIALAKSGIVNGVGGNEFMPDKNSTRAEAAKMLYEAYIRVK